MKKGTWAFGILKDKTVELSFLFPPRKGQNEPECRAICSSVPEGRATPFSYFHVCQLIYPYIVCLTLISSLYCNDSDFPKWFCVCVFIISSSPTSLCFKNNKWFYHIVRKSQNLLIWPIRCQVTWPLPACLTSSIMFLLLGLSAPIQGIFPRVPMLTRYCPFRALGYDILSILNNSLPTFHFQVNIFWAFRSQCWNHFLGNSGWNFSVIVIHRAAHSSYNTVSSIKAQNVSVLTSVSL